VIKSRTFELLYRNDGALKFREAAINRAGTLYLAKGENKAIYGGLTFVKVKDVNW
jgi:hypothetical protein